ncbi:MAG: glutamate--tRNA ligase family protein [Candidatus Nanopelagicales bacterium]
MSAARTTRLAPTPSGYLHFGNAVNLSLISTLASRWGAQTALRIDDMDSTRSRPEYIDDIFETLQWLEIPWTHGPRDRADFVQGFTMSARTDYYRSQLALLSGSGLEVFACACSRAVLEATGGMRCAGECRTAELDLVTDRTSLRLRIPESTVIDMGGVPIDLAQAHGDVVLWRRDGLPAYHLVTVVEDRDLGVTDVVRGADLLESSALHCWLGGYLDAPNVVQANYVHHELITDDGGMKLSKSQLGAGPLKRTASQRAAVIVQAAQIASDLGY